MPLQEVKIIALEDDGSKDNHYFCLFIWKVFWETACLFFIWKHMKLKGIKNDNKVASYYNQNQIVCSSKQV